MSEASLIPDTPTNEGTTNDEVQVQQQNVPGQEEGKTEPADKTEEKLFAGKYKTPEELEKGYKELTAHLQKKNPGAPEAYKFDYKEDKDFSGFEDILKEYDFEKDSEVAKYTPLFKELGISQEAASKLVKAKILDDLKSMPNPAEELKKLGDEAKTLLPEIGKFVKRFPEAEQAKFRELGMTADGVRFIEKIMRMSGEKAIPRDNTPVVTDTSAADEMKKKAYDMKTKTPGFDQNTKAIAEYESLMDQAMRIELASKRK